jgi:hypothetical protein
VSTTTLHQPKDAQCAHYQISRPVVEWKSYVAAAGDPPTPYLGQPLLMEIVVFHPASGIYWSGSVRDQRGVTSQPANPSAFNYLNPQSQVQTQAGNGLDPLEDVATQMGGLS